MKDIIKDFPILNRKIHDMPLIYLDNAATKQISSKVVEAMTEYEYNHRSNIHRGIHTLGEESSDMYESARNTVAKFIGAEVPSEIVFTKNSSESINVVAYSWGLVNLGKDDIILLSEIEHNSNLLPWQNIASATGCRIECIEVSDKGEVTLPNIDYSRVKLLSITHVSNSMGLVIDIKDIRKKILKKGAADLRVLLDISQSVAHLPINVKKLGVDFAVFSAHKMYGPMGVGVLYVKRNLHDEIGVFMIGGGTVVQADFGSRKLKEMPQRLEVGTPNVTGVIGLARACDYLGDLGIDNIAEHERDLMEYATDELKKLESIEIIGSLAKSRIGIVSFLVNDIPAHDVSAVLDMQGVQVRSGQHCAMAWHKKYNIAASTRVSFGIYNTKKDIDVLIKGLKKVKKIIKI